MNVDGRPTEPLCWLHLSDIHVSGDDWQQNHVLRALLRDLPGLLEQVERTPQLVFVTGDIAYRGAEVEYDCAFRFLNKLCEKLDIDPSDRLFLVPGNHDVDRNAISTSVALSQRAFDSFDEDNFRTVIGQLLGSTTDLASYGKRLANWCDFTENLLGPARGVSIHRPFRSDIVKVGGVAVGIASICSAWTSGPTEDKPGQLIVGERQVLDLVDELDAAGPQVWIALLHHPLDWLREAEAKYIRRLLRDEFDVVLHGHAHHSEAIAAIEACNGTVEIGGGAIYAGLGQDRFHGFTVVQLDVDAAQIDIDAFTWTTQRRFWHLDAGFCRGAHSGRMTLPLALPRLGQTASSVVSSAHEPLVTRLRRVALGVYRAQNFVGFPQNAPRPSAHIDDMFVPLELREGDSDDIRQLEEFESDWLCPPTEEDQPPARVVILGNPGSGKSTLVRYLAVRAAGSDALAAPLLLTARDWVTEGEQESLLHYACLYAQRFLQIPTEIVSLELLCERGDIVLIVDGVDECSRDQRLALRDCVQGFAADYPNVPILVTSRIVDYGAAAFSADQFEQFVLEPLDDGRLRRFIERWYVVAEHKDPVERQRKQDDLWSALEAAPRTKDMARTPLLATLLALVHFHHAQLPVERAHLHELCVETLVVTWPGAAQRTISGLEGQRQLPMLEELALWMQHQRPERAEERDYLRGPPITRRRLTTQLENLLSARRPESDDGELRELAGKWRDWLVGGCGLLQEQQANHYAFVHLSVMEYLAGQAVLRAHRRDGNDSIVSFVVSHHERPAWHETLLLMLGSENDPVLGNLVVQALIALDPLRWATGLFLLDLLREGLLLDPDVREQGLNAIAMLASDDLSASVDQAISRISDIFRLGRSHAEPLQQWFKNGLAQARGRQLVGLLHLLPKEYKASLVLDTRDDDDLELTVVSDLARGRWGEWARARAGRSASLNWAMGVPVGQVMREIIGAANSKEPEVWIPAVLQQMAWVCDELEQLTVLAVLTDGDGSGDLTDGGWPTEIIAGETAARFAPSICVTSQLGVPEQVPTQPSDRNLLPLARLYFTHFILTNASPIHHLLTRVASALEADAQRDYDAHIELLGELLTIFSDMARPTQIDDEEVTLLLARLAIEASAGLFFSWDDASGATRLASIRLQNKMLNLDFDLFVRTYIDGTPTPEQHALLLTLGLAQYQTTWSWPDGELWQSWFGGSPPEYWLATHVWHLCRAAEEPDNPEHKIRAASCLERGNWPNLVGALRQFTLSAPSPELCARFDDAPFELIPQ